MSVGAAVAALIGVFVVGVFAPLKPLGSVVKNTAENAASGDAGSVFVSNASGEMQFIPEGCPHAFGTGAKGVYRQISGRYWIHKVLGFPTDEFQLPKIVMARGPQISSGFVGQDFFQHDPAFFYNAALYPAINQRIYQVTNNSVVHDGNIPHNQARPIAGQILKSSNFFLFFEKIGLEPHKQKLTMGSAPPVKNKSSLSPARIQKCIGKKCEENGRYGGDESTVIVERMTNISKDDIKDAIGGAIFMLFIGGFMTYLAGRRHDSYYHSDNNDDAGRY